MELADGTRDNITYNSVSIGGGVKGRSSYSVGGSSGAVYYAILDYKPVAYDEATTAGALFTDYYYSYPAEIGTLLYYQWSVNYSSFKSAYGSIYPSSSVLSVRSVVILNSTFPQRVYARLANRAGKGVQ